MQLLILLTPHEQLVTAAAMAFADIFLTILFFQHYPFHLGI